MWWFKIQCHPWDVTSLWHCETCWYPLRWRHHGLDSVPNHQPHDCLLNRSFGHRSKKTSKLRVTGLCVGNSQGPVNSPHKGPVTRKMFPFDDAIMNKDLTARFFYKYDINVITKSFSPYFLKIMFLQMVFAVQTAYTCHATYLSWPLLKWNQFNNECCDFCCQNVKTLQVNVSLVLFYLHTLSSVLETGTCSTCGIGTLFCVVEILTLSSSWHRAP